MDGGSSAIQPRFQAASFAAPAPPMAGGEETLRATVTVSWEIKQ
jgi:uncharacterized protein YggE